MYFSVPNAVEGIYL